MQKKTKRIKNRFFLRKLLNLSLYQTKKRNSGFKQTSLWSENNEMVQNSAL